MNLKNYLDILNEEILANAPISVSTKIPVNVGHHTFVRLKRDNYEGVTEDEIIYAVKMGANEVVKTFLEKGKTEFLIYNPANNLNVVLGLQQSEDGGNNIEMKTITVMKKKDFMPKPGTYKIILGERR